MVEDTLGDQDDPSGCFFGALLCTTGNGVLILDWEKVCLHWFFWMFLGSLGQFG